MAHHGKKKKKKKIRIKKVPNGFEIRNGKIMKKASYGGGFVTGDQMDYGLVTTYANNGNGEKKDDVRYSLSSVPREFANIEAEGGETVLSDLNDNGTFGLYNITGPRHSQGGVPMFLPDQSFIFSDTPKMRMKPDEIAGFGIETKKRMTPAELSKKFPLNEFIAAAGSPDSDNITERSAELMLDKNMMSLSKLAFGQEMKKGFEDGVPTAAFPFIQSQGQDPVNFAAMMDAQIAQNRAKAAYGMEIVEDEQPVLPKGQDGVDVETSRISPDGKSVQLFLNDSLANEIVNPYNKDLFRQMHEMQMLKYKENLQRQRMMYDLEMQKRLEEAQKERESGSNMTLPIPKAQDGTERTDFSNLPKAIENTIKSILEAAPDPQAPEVQQQIKAIIDKVNQVSQNTDISNEDQEEAVNEIVKIVADDLDNLGEGRIPLITESLAKIDNMLQDKGIEIRPTMDVGDQGIEGTQQKQESGLYGDVTEDNLKKWFDNNKETMKVMGYDNYDALVKDKGKDWFDNDEFVLEYQNNVNSALEAKFEEDPELRAQLEELDISKEDFIKTYGFDKDSTGTEALDGKFGEYTLNRRDFTGLPEKEEPEEEDPQEDPLPPGKVPAVPDFYRQDMVKMDALSKRDRDLLTPSRMAVEQIELDPVLLDPTRAIAAINEQAAIGADAAGMFGPQTLSANIARNTGTAFKNIANTLGKYDAANVGILNKADAFQAQLDMRTDAAERANYADVFDGTNLAIQNYMDERNLDREQFADLYANALTNRANTYNLNTLIPYFDIDPRSGGMIGNVDTAGLFKPMQPADPYANLEKMGQFAQYAKSLGLSDDLVSKLLVGSGAANPGQPSGYANTAAAGYAANAGNLGYQGNTVGKKGREVKAPAVPFYIGTTDGRRK